MRWLRLRMCRRGQVRLNLNLLKRKPQGSLVRPGLWAYQLEGVDGHARVHLRVEEDGSGLILINANRAVHLNPTATYMAWLDLEGNSEDQALRSLSRSFRVEKNTLADDYRQTVERIHSLALSDGACPIHDLELDIDAPLSNQPSAPYRMDLALTYRCNENCSHCYNARPRTYPELDTRAWESIISQLWEVGIPHICFTGGEATLREDLPALISCAEDNGQITGLLSNGRRLSDYGYAKSLRDAGLDHVQITIESARSDVHDGMVRAKGAWQDTVAGIRNALDLGLFVMTNTTLLMANASHIVETIDFLADLGVPTIGCNALIYSGKGKDVGTGIPEERLAPLLDAVKDVTERNGQRLIWYTPTQYCHFDPVQMQLGVKACTAAQYNMCVEPDGNVIPCQSFYEPLGNMLQDPWDAIWNHDLALWLRERKYVPDSCHGCAILEECGGGCPLSLLNQDNQQPLSFSDYAVSQIQMRG
jgi:radical SAM protein with 4Fe4S-binding SPASM domain